MTTNNIELKKNLTFPQRLTAQTTINEIKKALPVDKKKGVERILRIALTEYRNNPKLQRCSPDSILSSIMLSCQIGLEIDKQFGQSYLIPYNNVCTLQIGYRGIIELAYRSGFVTAIQPNLVYEGDEFEITAGSIPQIYHKLNLKNKGKKIGAYAIARLKSKDYIFKYMTIQEIHDHRDKYSTAYKSESPQAMKFWKESPDEMELKTVILKLSKLLPQSAEMIQAQSSMDDEEGISEEGISEEGISIDSHDYEVINESQEEGGKILNESPLEKAARIASQQN